MVQQYKIDKVNNFVESLKEKKNFILTNYKGLNVNDIETLRGQLREKALHTRSLRITCLNWH